MDYMFIILNENDKKIICKKNVSNNIEKTILKVDSIKDAEMLIKLAEVLDTTVSTLLGEKVTESKVDDLKAISEKLEVINLQLSQRKNERRKIIHWLLISLCVIIVGIFVVLILLNSPYLNWDYNDPEKAVLGVAIHSFEWMFIRIAPVIFIGLLIGIFFTRKKN